MDKQQLRVTMRHLNHSISQQLRDQSAANIFTQIEDSKIFQTAKTIAIFLDLPDEVPTRDTINRWHTQGRRIAVPRIIGECMEFVEFNPEELKIGKFGIQEPTSEKIVAPDEIDLMIVPAVALSRHGQRLGRGKGFYDRYLAQPSFAAYTIGICYPHQLLDEIPCEPHDRALSTVVTSCVDTPIPSIIVKVIAAAGDAANRLDCGIERLNSMGLSWVLLRLRIEFTRVPESNEELSIETWISETNRIASTRNFEIRDNRGEIVAIAVSQWCIIDLEARRAVDLTRSDIDYSKYIESRPTLIGRLSKIPQVSTPFSFYKHIATEADIDFNRHVNTIRYIEMMMATLPNEQTKHRGKFEIDIHFLHESLLGEELTISREVCEDTRLARSNFEITRSDGTTSVRATLSLDCSKS